VVATAGDRRDEDIREVGAVAARYFDAIIVREDVNPRGRPRGEAAALISDGAREAMADGARCQSLETELDELEATRRALDMGVAGDVVVVCVDRANEVWKELQRRQHGTSSASAAPWTEQEAAAL
jgi:cyanophycin synthetase